VDLNLFAVYCTGDVVVGDTSVFTEAVWPQYRPAGRFGRRATVLPLGERTVVAEVLRDSYGSEKQQHTVTLRVIESSGCQPLEPGTQTTRKARNIYRNETKRLPWADESARQRAAEEKHTRGDLAREARRARREESCYV